MAIEKVHFFNFFFFSPSSFFFLYCKYFRHSSKSIKVTKLSFCRNDSPYGKSFWQKDSLVTLLIYAYLNISACRKFFVIGMYPQGRPVRPWSHLNFQIPSPYLNQGDRFCPPLQRLHLNFPQSYIPV